MCCFHWLKLVVRKMMMRLRMRARRDTYRVAIMADNLFHHSFTLNSERATTVPATMAIASPPAVVATAVRGIRVCYSSFYYLSNTITPTTPPPTTTKMPNSTSTSTSTSTPTSTISSRFLETIGALEGRSKSSGIINDTNKKRSREEAVERFVALAPTTIWMTMGSGRIRGCTNTNTNTATDTVSGKQPAEADEKEVKTEEDTTAKKDGDVAAAAQDAPEESSSSSSPSLPLLKKQKKAPPLVLSSQEDLLKASHHRRYCQEQFELQAKELEELEETREEVLQSIVDVWGAYRYGLAKIAALQDLGEAPDAIMPGNF